MKAYLAGPDVFLPNAAAHARRRIEVCARYGIIGLAPLDEDVDPPRAKPGARCWQGIFQTNLAMMEAADTVIANLTPFRGPSADAGTLIEVGWFFGRGRRVFGYSNTAAPFAERNQRHLAVLPDPLPGVFIESFGLPDNLMVPGTVLAGGGCSIMLPPDGRDRAFDALDVFELCVATAARALGLRPPATR